MFYSKTRRHWIASTNRLWTRLVTKAFCLVRRTCTNNAIMRSLLPPSVSKLRPTIEVRLILHLRLTNFGHVVVINPTKDHVLQSHFLAQPLTPLVLAFILPQSIHPMQQVSMTNFIRPVCLQLPPL